MNRPKIEVRLPGFEKLAESYVLRTKLGPLDKPKKKKPPTSNPSPDAIAKEACAEIFADLARSGLAEKLASYGQPVQTSNSEGVK